MVFQTGFPLMIYGHDKENSCSLNNGDVLYDIRGNVTEYTLDIELSDDGINTPDCGVREIVSTWFPVITISDDIM